MSGTKSVSGIPTGVGGYLPTDPRVSQRVVGIIDLDISLSYRSFIVVARGSCIAPYDY